MLLNAFISQKLCDKVLDKVVNIYFFLFYSLPDLYKTQEMCDRAVSEDPFLIVYCPNKYITQKVCDESVDDPLAALKFIPDWFVTSKMIKTLFAALYADDNKLYFNKDFGNVVLNCNRMGKL